MRYPGRGRKRFLPQERILPTLLRNEIPRKGTETCALFRIWTASSKHWEMRYPGRGRKHEIAPTLVAVRVILRNEIPRKGTETDYLLFILRFCYIEKWDTPEGDGNNKLNHVINLHHFIEKWDTPEGDGNLIVKIIIGNHKHWEMRYPGRGRKLEKPSFFCSIFKIEKWDTPEGDGNKKIGGPAKLLNLPLRNEIPRKGTETRAELNYPIFRYLLRNEIPRKGTETIRKDLKAAGITNWEMRYPGRGRKPICDSDASGSDIELRNEIPRKGTETIRHISFNLRIIVLRNEIPRKGTETRIWFSWIRHSIYIEKWDTPEGDGNRYFQR